MQRSSWVPNHLTTPFLMSIGDIVLQWGLIEATINIWIAIIYHEVGGRDVDPKIPVALKRRLKFLRRCVHSVTPLKPFERDCIALLDRVSQHAPTRNTLIHGYLSSYDETTGETVFIALDVVNEDTIHKQREARFTIPELVKLGGVYEGIASDLTDMAERFCETFLGEKPSYSLFRPVGR